MTSRALLSPHSQSKMLFCRNNGRLAVEVWKTPCIVTRFNAAQCSSLINPCNPELSGVSNFPYFPKGGPVPDKTPSVSAHHIMGYASSWGGMSIGEQMLFPVSVVDGLVHLHGGWKLQTECSWKRTWRAHKEACPVGSAVATTGGDLAYNTVIHTTPPFYNQVKEPEVLLASCYRAALEMATKEGHMRIASPLLGAGARGFPVVEAIDVAADISRKWMENDADYSSKAGPCTLVFGLIEEEIAEKLIEALQPWT